MQKIQNKLKSQNGFTLLEVMIAMVIFAVGMLGLAGIQALSLESSHSSYSRSQAILLAYDMVDRMKANSVAGTAYEITTSTTIDETTVTMCDSVTCNSAQMANFDHWQWKSALPTLLISGQGQVVNTASTDYTITVHWDEDRSGATDTTCPPTAETHLRCFQLSTKL